MLLVLCGKMIKHAFKGTATSARFVLVTGLLNPKSLVFKVKHIVTVGEPLGCALANRCLAARWANGERLTNRAHKFETIPSEDAKESCRHVVWRPCSSSAFWFFDYGHFDSENIYREGG